MNMVEFTAFGIVHCNKALLPNARGEGRFALHVEVIFIEEEEYILRKKQRI